MQLPHLRRLITSFAAFLLLICATSLAQAQTVGNGGFETPAVNTFLSSPSGSGWSFSGPAGISSGFWSGSGFGVTGTHAGQFAYLQWNVSGGSLSQSINFPSAGTYLLSYALAGRDPLSGGTGNTAYSVTVSDGVLSASGTTTSDQPFTAVNSTLNIPAAGNYTLTFANTTGSGTDAFYVDSVTITGVIGSISATYTSASDMAVTASNPVLTGGTATLALGYAPATGTNLMVVKNTGLGFISGTFTNLAHGQAVALSFGGVTYDFVANYYGGTGNDLVLQWANVRPMAWGGNGFGQLGNNSTTQSNVPTAVLNSGVLSGKTVITFSAGQSHSLALCSDGTLAAWGYNSNGQLGNNSTTNSSVPVAVLQSSGVLAGKTVIAIAAGAYHSVALCADGTVATWGSNGYGGLGNNSTTSSSVPVAVNTSGVLSGKTVVALAAGTFHSLALCSDGTLTAWGYNSDGQLGNNSTTWSGVPVVVNPSGVLSGKTVVSIAVGEWHSMALCADGTVAAWGSNNNGQLGNNSTTDGLEPVVLNTNGVLSGKTVVAIAAGGYHSMALCADGTVAAWGQNGSGQLGNNSTQPSSVPVAVLQNSGVLSGKTVIAIAAGVQHSVALCEDGTLAAWGQNASGQLGNSSTTQSGVPVAVSSSTLAAGERFTRVGRVSTAHHTLALVAAPLLVPPTATTGLASSITSTGATLNGAVNANGTTTAVTFHYGTTSSYGQTATASLSPVSGTNNTAVSAVISGLTAGTMYHFRVTATNSDGTTHGSDATFTAAIANVSASYTTAGDVAMTASNPVLTGGAATLTLGHTPVAGTHLTVVKNTGLGFITGSFSNLAQGQVLPLTYGGVTYNFVANYYGGSGNDLVLQWANVRPLAWGYNNYGELGNNSLTNSQVPTAVLNSGVLSGKTVMSLAAGGYHSVALCSDGTVAAWGGNVLGELGNNSTTNSPVPVAVNMASGTSALYGKTVVSIAAGLDYSVALCSDGTVATWGRNTEGELGNNSTTYSLVPVAVNVASGTSALYGKTVVSIAAGQYHSLALCSDGTVAAWGWNGYGQLGNSSTTNSMVPVAVNVVNGTSALYGKTVVSIAAGRYHSVALCSDGTVAAWGHNGSGELGNNSTTDSQVPVAVNVVNGTSALYGKTVVSLAAGSTHSLALCSDGTVAAWGNNGSGQLGNSTANNRVPVAVNVVNGTSALYGKTVVSVAAGDAHSLALCSDGTAAAWGWNVYGELGNNSTTQSQVPVAVNASTLASGERFSLLGNSPVASHTLALVAAPPPPPTATTGVASSITATGATLNGTVKASGTSTTVTFQYGATTSYGQTATASQSPVSGSSDTSVSAALTSLLPGTYHFRVVATNSIGTAPGSDATFVIPIANATAAYTSASVVAVTASNPTLTGGTAVLSLGYAPMAGTNLTVVKNTGRGFINGSFSNLAQGQVVPLTYGGVTYNFVANYYGGSGNDLMLQWANVRPLAWGWNDNGQLGDDSTAGSAVPVAVVQSGVLSSKTVISVATGMYHSVALCADGTLAAWGSNEFGQLGNNSSTNSSVPVAVNMSGVLSGKTVIAVAAGQVHSLALCSDGTLAAWGFNNNGQLGDGSTTNSSVPVAVVQSGVLSGKTVIAVTAGSGHNLALCADGTLVAWGYNGQGQLGNYSTTNSSMPVAVVQSGVLSGKTVIAVTAGYGHSLALCADGTLAAWGFNFYGQLGDDSTAGSAVPVAVVQTGVLSGKTVIAVAAGIYHNLALCADGTLAAWGWNAYGMLGNSSTTNSSVPEAVLQSGVLAGKTVIAVNAGYGHSLALCADGTLAAWGYNVFGQLGNNSTTDSSVPVTVSATPLAAGERFTASSGQNACHTLALVAAPPAPEIAVEQPVGTGLTSGSGTISFGVMAAGSSSAAKTFTLKNLGTSDLTGIVNTQDGTHVGDYTVNTTGMTTTVVPNASTTFTVTFTPAAAPVTGARTAVLHIASDDADENPFEIVLSGTGLSQTYDSDSDGLNDAAEFQLASLGFDWQTAQPALVTTLTSNANTANLFSQAQVDASRLAGQGDVTSSPNAYSLYTQSQFQALSVGTPLLQKDGTSGQFKLTIGVQKSTDLMHFDAFPLTAPQTTVNAQGQLEFQFTVPDGAAFFRLQSQ